MLLANIGVPMITVQWPLMIAALVPVIIVESLLIRRWIPLSYREAFEGCTAANALSTFVGVPLAWLAMFVLQLAVSLPVVYGAEKWNWNADSPIFSFLGILFASAWLNPGAEKLRWVIPLAVAILLIPCFYISVWLERFVFRRLWPAHDRAAVSRAVFRANLASYALLFLIACIRIGYELIARHHGRP